LLASSLLGTKAFADEIPAPTGSDADRAPLEASPEPEPPTERADARLAGANSLLVVRVLLKGCTDVREEEVERILTTELAVDASHSESVKEPTWVVVACAGNKVVLEVHDPLSRKIVQRRFDFGRSKAQARGRLIALAAAELVLASWAELAVLPAPRVQPEGGPPDPDGRRLARDRVIAPPNAGTMLLGTDPVLASETRGPGGERIVYGDYVWERLPGRTNSRALALASIRKFPGHDGALIGGGVRYGSDLMPLHGWAVDMLVESGTLGGVRADNWSAGGMLYFVGESGRHLVLRGGAGLRAGLIRTFGPGSKSDLAFPAFWGWPLLAIAVSAKLDRLLVEVASEAGYATLPARPGNPESSRGVWLGVQLGFGLAL
jgi:hypothetical protein